MSLVDLKGAANPADINVDFDWAPYERKLNRMSKQELLEFLKKKGQFRKQHDAEYTKYQTQDYEMMNDIYKTMNERIIMKNDTIEALNARKVEYEHQLVTEENNRTLYQQKLTSRREKLGRYTVDIKNIRQELKRVQHEITPKMVKDLYILLEKKAPLPLTKTLEAMIGLLRNTLNPSNVDVELYMKRYEGLIYKMNRVDPALISEEVHDAMLAIIQDATPAFSNPNDPDNAVCVEFVSLLAWTSRFCVLVGHAIQEKKVKDDVAAYEEKMTQSQNKTNQITTILENFNKDNLSTYLVGDVEQDQNRLEKFMRIRKAALDEAEQIQDAYKHFEQNYFRELEAIVKNQRTGSKKGIFGA